MTNLSMLRDIQPPPPPAGVTDQEWGGALWVVGGLALIGLGALLRWRWGRRHQREALAKLERAARDWRSGRNGRQLAVSLSALLRDYSRRLDARAPALSGGDWLGFLDARASGGAFSSAIGQLLVELPYQRDGVVLSETDGDALIALVRRWLLQNVA